MLWGVSEVSLLSAAFALFLVALEFGFRVGRYSSERAGESAKSHVGALQAAMLGLLALLLGFTFAMAVSRFDTRKALVLEEANGIGSAALRARFLPSPQAEDVTQLLRTYVSARLDFYAAGVDPGRLETANAAASRIENELWALAVAAAAQDPRSVPTGLFIQSLNDVIDVREKRQVALDNHVPEVVLYLLYATSVAALLIVGYGCGLNGQRQLALNALVACLIALVLTTILDIDRPRRGLIQVSQDSLIRLQATLEHNP